MNHLKYLAMIGKKGGSVKSEKKAAAVRENGKKGGRPRSKKGNEGLAYVPSESW